MAAAKLGSLLRVFATPLHQKFINSSCLFPTTADKQRARHVFTTSVKLVKQINEIKDGNTTVIEGITVDSPRKNTIVALSNPSGCCSLCRLDLDLQHTDVLILSQFLRSDGCMLPRYITGLCAYQQKLVGSLVAQSQKAGLMPNLTPSYSHKDPKKRYGWKKFNRYFDPGPSGLKMKRYM